MKLLILVAMAAAAVQAAPEQAHCNARCKDQKVRLFSLIIVSSYATLYLQYTEYNTFDRIKRVMLM